MANIKKMEMADAISKNSKITFSKGFLGIGEKAVYEPTNSPLQVYINFYNAEEGDEILRIIDGPESEIEERVKNLPSFIKRAIGNYRIETAISKDEQFVAIHIMRYGNFRHSPIRNVMFYEGNTAKLLAEVLKR
ncbi:MAG: hypothetical protein WAR39_11210 [Prevotella sp.]